MSRSGTGFANGRYSTSLPRPSCSRIAVDGSTVTPEPAATICLIVSMELPSRVFWILSLEKMSPLQAGQASMTWSLKQLPDLSSSRVSSTRSSARTCFLRDSRWFLGSITVNGSR